MVLLVLKDQPVRQVCRDPPVTQDLLVLVERLELRDNKDRGVTPGHPGNKVLPALQVLKDRRELLVLRGTPDPLELWEPLVRRAQQGLRVPEVRPVN